MRSNAVRVVAGIGAIAIAVVLLVVLKDDGGDTTGDDGATTAREAAPVGGDGTKPKTTPSKPAIPTLVIRGGKPVGGVRELVYSAGDRIRFRVQSDIGDEVHVHGYDVSEEVPAGGSATLSFPASIEGIFEVEMHGSGELIAELRVNP